MNGTESDKEEHYAHIDELVMRYQEGHSESGLELLRIFGYHRNPKKLTGFLKKYYALLRYGVIQFNDRDTRLFIRLFTSDPQLKQELLPHFQYAHTKKAARKTVQMINDQIAHVTDTDLLQDLSMLLLNQVSKYRKIGKKINFCGYLYNSYRYVIHDYYSALFKDILFHKEFEEIQNVIDEDSTIENYPVHEELYFKNEMESLGMNWIVGRTATFPFDQLDIFERTILSLHDDKGLTLQEIGNRMGYHRDTIWKRRKQIKEKLKCALKSPFV